MSGFLIRRPHLVNPGQVLLVPNPGRRGRPWRATPATLHVVLAGGDLGLLEGRQPQDVVPPVSAFMSVE